MELRVNEVQLPAPVTFNYEELKQEIIAVAETYRNMAYTEDQMKAAKADKAKLNKLKKALNDERIRQEAEYMKPFQTFKGQIAEIIGIIDEPVQIIDKQLKQYEEAVKQEKLKAISEVFAATEKPGWLDLEQIYNPRWLNTTYTMSQIKTDIALSLKKIADDLAVIEGMPEISYEAKCHYYDSLDLSAAIAAAQHHAEIERQKREAAAAKAAAAMPAPVQPEAPKEEKPQAEEEPVQKQPEEEPKRFWVSFRAYLTIEQAAELKDFFRSRGIQIERV